MKKNINSNLKQLREALNLTQEQLARNCNNLVKKKMFSQRTISWYETKQCEPTIKQLGVLVRALGQSKDTLALLLADFQ
jgi:transcriptional regulator with XRE-family HTH domain